MMPKSSKSALLALAAAAGLWAWRNRDKIQSTVNTQLNRMNTQSPDQPMTGETRRIGNGDGLELHNTPKYDGSI